MFWVRGKSTVPRQIRAWARPFKCEQIRKTVAPEFGAPNAEAGPLGGSQPSVNHQIRGAPDEALNSGTRSLAACLYQTFTARTRDDTGFLGPKAQQEFYLSCSTWGALGCLSTRFEILEILRLKRMLSYRVLRSCSLYPAWDAMKMLLQCVLRAV